MSSRELQKMVEIACFAFLAIKFYQGLANAAEPSGPLAGLVPDPPI